MILCSRGIFFYMGTKISKLKGGVSMKRRYNPEAMTKLYVASRENDLKEVKKLIETGEAGVDKFACIDAITNNSYNVLQYFLQKNHRINDVWIPVMQDAAYRRKFLALKKVILYFREHKDEFIQQEVEDAILKTVASVASSSRNAKNSMITMGYIIDLYLK